MALWAGNEMVWNWEGGEREHGGEVGWESAWCLWAKARDEGMGGIRWEKGWYLWAKARVKNMGEMSRGGCCCWGSNCLLESAGNQDYWLGRVMVSRTYVRLMRVAKLKQARDGQWSSVGGDGYEIDEDREANPLQLREQRHRLELEG